MADSQRSQERPVDEPKAHDWTKEQEWCVAVLRYHTNTGIRVIKRILRFRYGVRLTRRQITEKWLEISKPGLEFEAAFREEANMRAAEQFLRGYGLSFYVRQQVCHGQNEEYRHHPHHWTRQQCDYLVILCLFSKASIPHITAVLNRHFNTILSVESVTRQWRLFKEDPVVIRSFVNNTAIVEDAERLVTSWGLEFTLPGIWDGTVLDVLGRKDR